ncbi:uncharacterized protein [Heterodontus francisci]|uniref:uncharacterized protein n=1 Tax=Heterodontus francisci TaxID=7792 RepID=UPI00355C43F5
MDGLIWVLFLAFNIIVLTGQGCVCTEILGGREVKPHSRPYMVSIQMNKHHICGGALIAQRWVLTAAHCKYIWKNKKIEVVLGAHSLSKRQEEKQQVLEVTKCFSHQQFNWKRKDNDIMLVKLAHDAILNTNVSTLKLPKSREDVKSGTKCFVAGWGRTNPENAELSNTLREVKVAVIDRKRCNSKAYYNYNPYITKDMLCAGDKKGRKDSCLGDSGGPLICITMFRRNNIYRGIVSAGDGCGKIKKPGIYTLLSETFLKWINETMTVKTQNNNSEVPAASPTPIEHLFIYIFIILDNCVKIIGGKEAVPHSKPYMVSIQYQKQHMCGGALIKPSWVLTAAHCQKQNIRVVLGAHSISGKEKEQQIFTVKRMIPHSLYDSKLLTNDIMLLQLNGRATLNKFVNVLSLPNSGKDVKDGVICNVAGWGVTRYGTKKTSDKLQQVNVTVVDRNLCSEYYTYNPAITEDVLCAGDKKGAKDSCQGDSGGPLLCDGQFNGIVSFGCDCGKPKKPGIYTRLSNKYLSWIKKTIR